MIKHAFAFFACALLLCTACKKQSFLDPVVTTNLNEESVFTDSARTMDFLINIYTGVDFSFDDRRFGDRTNMSAATDEAEGSKNVSDNTYLLFASGSVNPSNVKDDAYARPWQYIRAANQVLKYISNAKFSQAQRDRVKGEALFLRAWYYALMMKHYGGVPIIGDTIYKPSDFISTKRNTYEECVNYVVEQCDAAEKLLSASYNQMDYGRVTTGACQALKARVLLYAASPLFNDNGSIGGQTPMNLAASEDIKKLVGYPNYNKERWKLAADAAYRVMQSGTYSLNFDNTTSPGYGFYWLFLNKLSRELIFFRADPGFSLEETFGPPSRRGFVELQGTYPYQELVDAFDMRNGKPITDPTSGYDPARPYENRDPRFNATICHNGSLKIDYNGLNSLGFKPILTYVDAGTDAVHKGTATGYYVNKMLRDSTDAKNFLSGANRAYPLIRYAEILLNYAEAKNEYDNGPRNKNDSVYTMLRLIRQRAGISPGTDAMFGLKDNMTQAEMRAAIQHERRIELAFEEHRFWDVRRWKIAEETENKLMNGVEIILQRNTNNFTYQRFAVRQHKFYVKNYLWPFPQREVSKPGGLEQNPGY